MHIAIYTHSLAYMCIYHTHYVCTPLFFRSKKDSWILISLNLDIHLLSCKGNIAFGLYFAEEEAYHTFAYSQLFSIYCNHREKESVLLQSERVMEQVRAICGVLFPPIISSLTSPSLSTSPPTSFTC